jgi:hypothetical protein
MPNFNTHWLVAIKCIETSDSLPNDIKIGFSKFKAITNDFKEQITEAIYEIINPNQHKSFIKASSKQDSILDSLFKEYEKDLTDPENHNPITIFSAYMLGACGPDFWTVTSPGWGPNPIPQTAGIHFDLGHYNRTHRQFQVAIERWVEMKKDPGKAFQLKVEQAYFYGMATHIAADCVIHQLVNVSAGAYNLLEKKWKNEHGDLPKKLWSTHNKVEHYWDSYVRYRYLGDTGPVFKYNPEDAEFLDKDQWMFPLGFLTVETLIANLTKELDELNGISILEMEKDDLKRHEARIEAKEKLIKSLRKEKVKLKIEKPFIFPRIFCDRVNAENNPVLPFIYEIVVKKDGGAYPGKITDKGVLEGIIFREAVTESNHYQMKAGKDRESGKPIYSEENKLAYFNSKSNEGAGGTSFNYLNYYVCPDLEKVRYGGWDRFFHTEALGPFIDSAGEAGIRFIRDLSAAIENDAPDRIGALGKFWNLDTGLGLEVNSRRADTPHEVLTELKFIHIGEIAKQTYMDYKENPVYLEQMGDQAGEQVVEKQAFNTYDGGIFDSMVSVFEKGGDTYLSKIRMKTPVDAPDSDCTIDDFFSPMKKMESVSENAHTGHDGTVFQVNDIQHRLNLSLTVPVAQLSRQPKPELHIAHINYNDYKKKPGYKGDLAFYLWNDKKDISGNTVPANTEKWLKKDSKIIDCVVADTVGSRPGRYVRKTEELLCFFETRLLVNLENDPKLERIVEKGKWNNVIQYGSYEKKHYSRTYCVGTGRYNVLHPTGAGRFDSRTHFHKKKGVSPTEQVFWALYLLVKTRDGCFDMLTKEPVEEKKLAEIIRITTLGIVKIVLFYELNALGAVQLKECYLDGLRVGVNRV